MIRLNSRMKGWQIKNGSLFLNESVPVPPITSPNHVLVKIHASSVNPLDSMMTRGYGDAVLNSIRNCTGTPSITLGRDFSGVVLNAGKNVTSVKTGDSVWGATFPSEFGTHSEYTLVQESHLNKKPDNLSHIEAASIPYAALTAWSSLFFTGRAKKGSKVAVVGVSGGVGLMAAQILKTIPESYVLGICSSDAVDTVMGPDEILDYTSPEFEQKLSNFKNFDIVLDCSGNKDSSKYKALMNKNTIYITLTSPVLSNTDSGGLLQGTLSSLSELITNNLSYTAGIGNYRWGYFMPCSEALRSITKMAEDKRLVPVIQKVYPFHKTPGAYYTMEKGHARGKIVIDHTLK